MARRLTLILFLLLASGSMAFSQAGIGHKYGTRDPHVCKSTKAPAKGAITVRLAKEYLLCDTEAESGGFLYLLENVKVEVGKGRRYNPKSDDYTDIDSSSLVYPIRGSYTEFQCSAENRGSILYNIGKNCNSGDQPHALGLCYRTTFSDWHCSMMDMAHSTPSRFGVAPPTN